MLMLPLKGWIQNPLCFFVAFTFTFSLLVITCVKCDGSVYMNRLLYSVCFESDVLDS